MSDKIVYSDGGGTNTLLIIIVIALIAGLGFLFATGRLGNTPNSQDSAKTMDVNVTMPQVPDATPAK